MVLQISLRCAIVALDQRAESHPLESAVPVPVSKSERLKSANCQ